MLIFFWSFSASQSFICPAHGERCRLSCPTLAFWTSVELQPHPTTKVTWKELRVDPATVMLCPAAGVFPTLYGRWCKTKANEEDILLGANLWWHFWLLFFSCCPWPCLQDIIILEHLWLPCAMAVCCWSASSHGLFTDISLTFRNGTYSLIIYQHLINIAQEFYNLLTSKWQ